MIAIDAVALAAALVISAALFGRRALLLYRLVRAGKPAARFGDLPSYAEYHWHGFQLIAGNAFVLTGLLLFGLLLVLAWIAPAAPAPRISQAA